METELFDWVDWDENGGMSAQFYEIKLRKQIGEFPIGSYFDIAVVDFERGTLQLCRLDGQSKVAEHHDFKLKLSVGQKIRK